MIYCDNPDDDEPIFRLYDQIGKSELFPDRSYVDGNVFARELAYLATTGKKYIWIYINCEGGNIKDGWSIWSAMLESDCPVNTHVVGVAYSMAGVLALGGKKRTALSTSSWMYHMGWLPSGEEDRGLDVLNESMLTGIAERWGKDKEEVKRILEAETYYNSHEAEPLGLVTEPIIHVNDLNAPKNSKDVKAQAVYAMAYLKQALSKTKIMNKAEICALLNLDPNVSDDYAMNALKEMKARASKPAKAVAKATDDDEDDEDCSPEMKAMIKRAKAAEAKLAEAEASKKAEEEAKAADKDMEAKKAQALSAITAKATERGLKLEEKAITNYIALAVTSESALATVIETIESIEVVKKAATFRVPAQASASITKPEEKFVTKGVDDFGQPVVTDTSAMTAFMNAKVRAQASKRFNPEIQ